MRVSVTAIAAAVGALLALQPAYAESIAVPYRDLDLTTDKGRKELDYRVDHAAKKVCGLDEQMTGSRIASPESRDCYADARKQIEKKLATIIDHKAAAGG